jgi:hypothetical protein
MLAGRTPALNAARTAFTLPLGSSTCASFACLWWRWVSFRGAAFPRVADARRGKVSESLAGALPRRFISSTVAACSFFNSSSFRCLTALVRSFGRTCRCGGGSAVSVPAGVGESGSTSAERGPGEGLLPRWRPMVRLWPPMRGTAILPKANFAPLRPAQGEQEALIPTTVKIRNHILSKKLMWDSPRERPRLWKGDT